MTKKIKVTDYYTLWLRAGHLPPKGRKATIVNVTVETLHPTPTEERKAIVLTFRETNKKMALNQTQANSLVEILGEDTDKWPGEKITLTPKPLNRRQDTIVIDGPDAPAQAEGAAE